MIFPFFINGDLPLKTRQYLDEAFELSLRRRFTILYLFSKTPQEYYANVDDEHAYKFYMQHVDGDTLCFVDRHTNQRLKCTADAALGIFDQLAVTDFTFSRFLDDAENNGGIYTNTQETNDVKRAMME
jgi:hypothetical protein